MGRGALAHSHDGAGSRTRAAPSLAILGVTEHHWLDYYDGTCDQVPREEGVARIRAFIDDVRPATVLTFGPEGMTGHADHKSVSAWTTEAVADAARRVRTPVRHPNARVRGGIRPRDEPVQRVHGTGYAAGDAGRGARGQLRAAARAAGAEAGGGRGACEPGRGHDEGVRARLLPAGDASRVLPAVRGWRVARAEPVERPERRHRPRLGRRAVRGRSPSGRSSCGTGGSNACRTCPSRRASRRRRSARRCARDVPDEPMPDDELFEHLRERGVRLVAYPGHPRFMAYVSGAGTVPGAAAELLAAGREHERRRLPALAVGARRSSSTSCGGSRRQFGLPAETPAGSSSPAARWRTSSR